MKSFKSVIISSLLGAAGRLLLAFISWFKDRRVWDTVVKLAEAYVGEAEGTALSGAEKKEQVKRKIQTDLSALGIVVKDFMINLAIELAVAGVTEAGKALKDK